MEKAQAVIAVALALAFPSDADPLRDVVVLDKTAYVFRAPQFVAKGAGEMIWVTKDRLVFAANSAPETVSNPNVTATLGIWKNGKKEIIQTWQSGPRRLTIRPLGPDGAAVWMEMTQNSEEISSTEFYRFTGDAMSVVRTPAGYEQGFQYDVAGQAILVSWFTSLPPVDFRQVDYSNYRMAVYFAKGEPILAPPSYSVEFIQGGKIYASELVPLVATTPGRMTRAREPKFIVWDRGSWKETPRVAQEARVRYGGLTPEEERGVALMAPALQFNWLSQTTKKVDPPLRRRELWATTTDPLGPNRVLLSPDAEHFSYSGRYLAVREQGMLSVREVVEVPRAEFETVAEPAERNALVARAKRFLEKLEAATKPFNLQSLLTDRERTGFEFTLGKALHEPDAYKSADPNTEVGRFKGRYGALVFRRNGTTTWQKRV